MEGLIFIIIIILFCIGNELSKITNALNKIANK